MKISDALATVNKFYVPGVAKFYNGMNPDPWFQAHEDFEQAVITQDEFIIATAATDFVNRCNKLVTFYKEQNSPQRGLSSADALFLGNEEEVKKWQSRKHKHCYVCEGKKNLKIVADPANDTHTVIVCDECRRSLYT